MNLFGLFQNGNRNTDARRPETVRLSANAHISDGGRLRQTAKNLTPGQTLQGEIVSKNGDEVQIRIDKDLVITARLENNMNASVGQNITFEVKSNSDVQIALRPLFENLSQDANVMKALEAAKLPLTDEMMRMVNSMMKEGMSIDKNALQEMGRLIMSNPEAAPETIVAMHHMQLHLTPENIQQFVQYRNYEHQILNTVTDILSQLPETFQMIAATGGQEAAVDFYSRILQLFSGISSEEAKLPEQKVFSDIIKDAELEIRNEILKESVTSGKEQPIEQTAEQGTSAVTDRAGENAGKVLLNPQDIKDAPLFLTAALNESEQSQLSFLLEKLGFTKEQLIQVQNGSVQVRQLLQDVSHLLTAGGESINKECIVNLFGSKVYNQLLNSEIVRQWLLKPESVSQKDNVEAFYGRLREQTSRLTETFSQVLKDTPLSKSLTAMQNNIDFMNQINQTFHYIQLPLKMSNGNAHGDLYVYTNKKSTLNEDGSVSALLHLDMEYLGTMDIHVAMREQNVSTKFYFKDESIIDFMAGHIQMLNEKLSKRGYRMTAEMAVNEKNSTDVIENMTADERKESILAQYSFDVRA